MKHQIPNEIPKEAIHSLIRHIGRIEGIAFATEKDEIRNALLDALEQINPIVDMLEAIYG